MFRRRLRTFLYLAVATLGFGGFARGQNPLAFYRTDYPILDPGLTDLTPIVVADVNEDGKPDIIVGFASFQAISVLLGNGDGTFQAPQILLLPASATRLSALLPAISTATGT